MFSLLDQSQESICNDIKSRDVRTIAEAGPSEQLI